MNDIYDIAVVGGGINGCGIARDAGGRGLRVFLCEQNDLGGATSSASSKLIHGGLRYLEQCEFKLVWKSLYERKRLLKSAPHLIKPMQFVLPYHYGLRPQWLIRVGLFLYDLLGGRQNLARSARVNLTSHHHSCALQPQFISGFTYTDCWADDARLVIAVAKDAQSLGAVIAPRTRCVSAVRSADFWQLQCDSVDDSCSTVKAKVLVNATGPWLAFGEQFVGGKVTDGGNGNLNNASATSPKLKIKLVQGGHIVVRKWYDGAHAYILQNSDQRVVFVIPFQRDLAIIGTTEVAYNGDPAAVKITPAETEYLCNTVNEYFARKLTVADVVWSYSGVRPLYDDGASDLHQVTRDYVVKIEGEENAAPSVTIYGGKLTTFRRLAETTVTKLSTCFPAMKPAWTANAILPGGDISSLFNDSSNCRDIDNLSDELQRLHPFLPPAILSRYASTYGSEALAVIGNAQSISDLGLHFGHGLYQAEVTYLMHHEWAVCSEDILWRRTKLGLKFTDTQVAKLTQHIAMQI